jgi:hypothetical protein
MKRIRAKLSRPQRMEQQREEAKAKALREAVKKDAATVKRELAIDAFRAKIKKYDVKIKVKDILIERAKKGGNSDEVERLTSELETLRYEQRRVWNELRRYTKSIILRRRF